MGKILFFLVALFLALFVLRLLNSRNRLSKPSKNSDTGATQGERIGAEPMLACKACGALVPRSEAVMAHGLPYCSREHADKAGE